MAKNNTELATQIAGAGGAMTPLAIQGKFENWRAQHGKKFAALVGDEKTADKFFVVCMNTIARNPALIECDFASLTSCMLQSFQLNLFPGPFAECAYVPLFNGKTQRKEANFWIQYPGIVKLIRNAGNKAVVARVVCEGDYFEYKEGDSPPVFAPAAVMGKKRGGPLFCYAAICTTDNLWQVEVMSPEQIAVTKSRSRGATKQDSPWNSKYEDDVYAMWSKTVLKRAAKWCTKSAELVRAIEVDDEIENENEPRKVNIFEVAKQPSEMLDEPQEVIGSGNPVPRGVITNVATGEADLTPEDIDFNNVSSSIK